MPKFAKGSKEAKEYMASIRGKRGSSKGKGAHMEGGKAFDFFDDLIIPMGNKAGAPYKAATGVNPFEMGFALGRDVIAPELMKVLPPKGRGMKGGKAFDFFDDLIIPVGKKVGEPYKAATGVNPFEMGFALGRDVIAPELMKVFPPKGRGMVGGVKGIRPGVHMATMGGEGMGEMEYCPCHHCGGMGIKKKTRM